MAEKKQAARSVAEERTTKEDQPGSDLTSSLTSTEGESAILNMALIKSILEGSGTKATESSRDESVADSGSRLAMGRKGVSFSGIDSLNSSTADEDKEHSALVEKVARLENQLEQAKQDFSAQRAIRKKKEKNVVKLAKELTKRVSEIAKKDEEIARVRMWTRASFGQRLGNTVASRAAASIAGMAQCSHLNASCRFVF